MPGLLGQPLSNYLDKFTHSYQVRALHLDSRKYGYQTHRINLAIKPHKIKIPRPVLGFISWPITEKNSHVLFIEGKRHLVPLHN